MESSLSTISQTGAGLFPLRSLDSRKTSGSDAEASTETPPSSSSDLTFCEDEYCEQCMRCSYPEEDEDDVDDDDGVGEVAPPATHLNLCDSGDHQQRDDEAAVTAAALEYERIMSALIDDDDGVKVSVSEFYNLFRVNIIPLVRGE